MRHTFISRLAENPKVSEQTIKVLAGHSTGFAAAEAQPALLRHRVRGTQSTKNGKHEVAPGCAASAAASG